MKSISISSFAAILLIWTITACSPSNRVTGSNNYITKQIKVEKFNGLQLTGSPDVIYKQTQGRPSVEVYGQDNTVFGIFAGSGKGNISRTVDTYFCL